MKVQVTKKQITSTHRHIIKLNYGMLQRTLIWLEPTFFTSGKYGWNCDIYDIGLDILICTGARPFGNIELSRNEIIDLQFKADKIISKQIPCIKKQDQIKELLRHEIFGTY
jgi:hypothetical protein